MEKILQSIKAALDAVRKEDRRTPHLATTEAHLIQAADRLGAHLEFCATNPPPAPTAPAAPAK